jgi:hypothetical protein
MAFSVCEFWHSLLCHRLLQRFLKVFRDEIISKDPFRSTLIGKKRIEPKSYSTK